MTSLWIRHEERATEQRAPIVPADARRLVEQGLSVVVESSPQRVFALAEYADAGCRLAGPGSWRDAPDDHYVVGLKELPDMPAQLRHRHIYFGHAYKRQVGARELLRRFAAGGGELLDVEYLVDDAGRRLAAFGYWAGYAGAALALLHVRGVLRVPLVAMTRASLDAELRRAHGIDGPRVLVIGALGRAGRGARDALATAGVTPSCWDVAETRALDRAALLDHDVLVNTVLTTRPIPPFLTPGDLDDPDRRLTVVADVTCDVTSECNVLPVYDANTTWQEPVHVRRDVSPPLHVIAIDNLPSLLPREASIAFSRELVEQLLSLEEMGPAWQRCSRAYHAACTALGAGAGFSRV